MRRINIPTRVYVDEQDELVNVGGLQEFIDKNELTKWRIFKIEVGGPDKGGAYHHQLFDPSAVGHTRWQTLLNEIQAHFQ